MPQIDQVVEQRILEYESRLKHIDELLRRAHGASPPPEVHGELAELKGKRETLANEVEALKRKPPEDWRKKEITSTGPLAVWDIVAQQLEKLVERLGG
ncbi:MAG TPA: hypothetical protein VMH34_04495 [Gammaproteobacteria bacterium]|nr:hypothetical protein [Gammaproteobacteria bacterium]